MLLRASSDRVYITIYNYLCINLKMGIVTSEVYQKVLFSNAKIACHGAKKSGAPFVWYQI